MSVVMKRAIVMVFVIFAFVLQSCEYDYDIEKHFGGVFAPKVVLNSIINPDSLIRGDIYWTKHINDKDDIKRVEEFDAKLYENDQVIFHEECVNGEIVTDIYPKEGASYHIEVSVPQYGMVRASTNIPTTSTFTYSYDGAKGGDKVIPEGEHDFNRIYWHYTIDNIITTKKSRALWLGNIATYSDGTVDEIYAYYLNNPFCDQINAVRDAYDISLKGSEITHKGFIRISYKNIAKSLPLKFSTWEFNNKIEYIRDENNHWTGEYIEIPLTGTYLFLITPSDDYDKYMKSTYRQLNFSDMGLPIFNEMISIHSNVENGVGIFAGYTIETHKYEQEGHYSIMGDSSEF